MKNNRVTVQVIFENGDSLISTINTTFKGAEDYYLGKNFNLGIEDDLISRAVNVKLIKEIAV